MKDTRSKLPLATAAIDHSSRRCKIKRSYHHSPQKDFFLPRVMAALVAVAYGGDIQNRLRMAMNVSFNRAYWECRTLKRNWMES